MSVRPAGRDRDEAVRERGMAWRNAQIEREDYAYEDEQGEHRNFRLVLEVLETAVLTLLLFMTIRLTVQNFNVDGPSMQPTLHTSELILVNRAEYLLHDPRRGDIVVFNAPPEPSTDYVKRIIGIPGDTVQIGTDGAVYVNGTRIREPYVTYPGNPCWDSVGHPDEYPKTWKLQPRQYFVLGDNRGDSSDSRCWGVVKRDLILGKAALVYWPSQDVHLIPDASASFASVKK
jgi:signal peptidase I